MTFPLPLLTGPGMAIIPAKVLLSRSSRNASASACPDHSTTSDIDLPLPKTRREEQSHALHVSTWPQNSIYHLNERAGTSSDEETSHTSLNGRRMPVEILTLVIEHLQSLDHVAKCMRVCKLWHEVSLECLWRKPSINIVWNGLIGEAAELAAEELGQLAAAPSPFAGILSSANSSDAESIRSGRSMCMSVDLGTAVLEYLSPYARVAGSHVRSLNLDSLCLYNRPKDQVYRCALAGLAAVCTNLQDLEIDSRFTKHKEHVGDDILLRFRLENLRSLRIESASITDAVLDRLGAVDNGKLQSLSFAYCRNLTVEGLLGVLTRCSSIQNLNLLEPALVSSKWVCFVAGRYSTLRELRLLGFLCADDLPDDFLEFPPAAFSSLKVFEMKQPIYSVPPPGTGIGSPPNSPSSPIARSRQTDPSIIASILSPASSRTLTQVHLFGPFVTDDLVDHIVSIHGALSGGSLQVLKLGQCRLSPYALHSVTRHCSKLTEFELRAVCLVRTSPHVGRSRLGGISRRDEGYGGCEIVDDAWLNAFASRNAGTIQNLFIKLRVPRSTGEESECPLVSITEAGLAHLMRKAGRTLVKLSLIYDHARFDLDRVGEVLGDCCDGPRFEKLREFGIHGIVEPNEDRKVLRFIERYCCALEVFDCDVSRVAHRVQAMLVRRKRLMMENGFDNDDLQRSSRKGSPEQTGGTIAA
ncbi:hypothetical protein BJ742DRAFT_858483 [Cladochytrium replicatum]|nr:hypothetical protein BJ742DRAFT_858483 [Cladochytrium replicatum]